MKKRNKWLAEDARRYSKIIRAKIMEKYTVMNVKKKKNRSKLWIIVIRCAVGVVECLRLVLTVMIVANS